MPLGIPSIPGTYALFLTLSVPAELTIGKLGAFAFPAGWYVYTGSARGPGGLQARLRHHLRPASRPHWHIDHLRTQAVVTGGSLRGPGGGFYGEHAAGMCLEPGFAGPAGGVCAGAGFWGE